MIESILIAKTVASLLLGEICFPNAIAIPCSTGLTCIADMRPDPRVANPGEIGICRLSNDPTAYRIVFSVSRQLPVNSAAFSEDSMRPSLLHVGNMGSLLLVLVMV